MTSPIARVGVLVSVAAAVAGYALMLLGYRQGWEWLAHADAAALDASYDIGVRHPRWVGFWDGVSTVFAPAMFRLLAIAAAAAAALRHRLRAALFLLVTVEATGLITGLAKGLVDRPRPATALVAASSSSFPSGHALGAMIGVGALLAVPSLLGRRARVASLCLGVLVVAAVGVSRVALGVHHPSDVLAGWALGWAYLSVWAMLLRPGSDGG